jgi:opacity protein-like surface antigen
MKKLFVLAGAVVLSSSLFAQKPTSDVKYSLEGNINYDATNGFSWTAPNIRARYFVNDNIAARVQLGLGSTSDKSFAYENADGTGGKGTIIDNESGWSMQLGAEYHLAGTSKMSPYFMGGLTFGGNTASTKGTDVDQFDDYTAGDKYSYSTKSSDLGFALGAGMDYYVAENMYLGLELGWGFSRVSDGGSKSSVTSAGTTVESEIPSAGSFSGMGTGAMNTAFRIGWRF